MSAGRVSLFPCLAAPDDRPLLTVDATTLTARDLLAAAGRNAAFLAAADIHPGDRVGVWTQPHLHTPAALAANALCGVVSVPLNPRLGAREAAHVAADAAPRLCLAAAPDELPVGPLGCRPRRHGDGVVDMFVQPCWCSLFARPCWRPWGR